MSKDLDLRHVLPCEFAGMMMGEFQSRLKVCFDFFLSHHATTEMGLVFFLALMNTPLTAFQPAEKSNFVIVLSNLPYLVPNVVLRGPFPLNGVQLVPSRMVEGDMKTFADMMNAALVRFDALSKISYVSMVRIKVAIFT